MTQFVSKCRLANDDAYGSVLRAEASEIEVANGRAGSNVTVAEFQQSEWVEAK